MAPKQAQPPDVIDLTSDDEEEKKVQQSFRISDDENDEDDEDIKLAIALSLQNHVSLSPTNDHTTAVTDHCSQSPNLESKTSSPLEPTSNRYAPLVTSGLPGFLGLNRKQMEVERLARLKRKRSDSLPGKPATLSQASKAVYESSNQASVVKKTASNPPSSQEMAIDTSGPANNNQSWQQNEDWLQYPNGKVLLTTTDPLRLKSAGNISLPQLLKPTQPHVPLKSALLSTFTIDFDWLFPHFDTKAVSFVLALHAANNQHRLDLEDDFGEIGNVKLVFPPVGGAIRCMHSKLMLLFYESISQTQNRLPSMNRCRIVVPTANLVPYDWGVGNVMENAVFVIDLPGNTFSASMGDNKSDRPTGPNTVFKDNLSTLLRSMHIPPAVMDKLNLYDFSATERLGFIHSIGGSHLLRPNASQSLVSTQNSSQDQNIKIGDQPSLPPASRTGLLCLTDTIKSLGLSFSATIPNNHRNMDYITSSLGNLKSTFLASLRSAVLGELKPLNAPISGPFQPRAAASTKIPSGHNSNIRVYFPSDHTVRRSKGGTASAGTICFNSKWWDATKEQFPKNSLRDCLGVREDGILMHSKILYVTFAQPQPLSGEKLSRPSPSGNNHENQLFAGWVYIGSANCTESAWGSIVTDSKTKLPKLNCGNWESGVVIPVPVSDRVRHKLASGTKLCDMKLQEIFADVVPVPFQEPAESYQDGRRPWFFNG